MSLDEYILMLKKRENKNNLEQEIVNLELIKLPLKIQFDKDKIMFFSDDYSLATNYSFELRQEKFVDKDYSNKEYIIIKEGLYPQFFFFINYFSEQKKF